jgi:hypothetical protein
MNDDYNDNFSPNDEIESTKSKTHAVEVETNENGTTKSVKFDSKNAESNESLKKNPYAKSIYLARAVDAWRPFPRLFITIYIYLLYSVIEWYTALPDPSMEQSGLISVVVGAGAAWFGLYVGSGSKGPPE